MVCPLHRTAVSQKESEAVYYQVCLMPGLLAAFTGTVHQSGQSGKLLLNMWRFAASRLCWGRA